VGETLGKLENFALFVPLVWLLVVFSLDGLKRPY
jgi:hypothetical protein